MKNFKSHTKMYSKQINQNVKPKTINFLGREKKKHPKKQKVLTNLDRQRCLTQDIKSTKQNKNGKVDFKKQSLKNENQATRWEELFVKIYLTKDLQPQYKELFKNTKTNKQKTLTSQ